MIPSVAAARRAAAEHAAWAREHGMSPAEACGSVCAVRTWPEAVALLERKWTTCRHPAAGRAVTIRAAPAGEEVLPYFEIWRPDSGLTVTLRVPHSSTCLTAQENPARVIRTSLRS